MVRKAWNGQQYKPVLVKISNGKDVRMSLLKWNKHIKAINQIKDKIDGIKGSSREAKSRELMQPHEQSNKAYKDEEVV